jgi:hypothetical protein
MQPVADYGLDEDLASLEYQIWLDNEGIPLTLE